MFIFVFGTHDFTSQLEGYANVTAQCHNCGNWSARVITRWQWFTLCWVPILPLGGKHKEVFCHVCRFSQELKHRPDIQSQSQQQQGGGAKPQGAPPGAMQPPGMQPPPPQQYQQPQQPQGGYGYK